MKEQTELIQTLITPELKEKLLKKSKEEHLKPSQYIRRILHLYLEKEEKTKEISLSLQ